MDRLYREFTSTHVCMVQIAVKKLIVASCILLQIMSRWLLVTILFSPQHHTLYIQEDNILIHTTHYNSAVLYHQKVTEFVNNKNESWSLIGIINFRLFPHMMSTANGYTEQRTNTVHKILGLAKHTDAGSNAPWIKVTNKHGDKGLFTLYQAWLLEVLEDQYWLPSMSNHTRPDHWLLQLLFK